jgi:hypothetical protein
MHFAHELLLNTRHKPVRRELQIKASINTAVKKTNLTTFLIYLAIIYPADKLRAFTPSNKNLGLFVALNILRSNLQWSVKE